MVGYAGLAGLAIAAGSAVCSKLRALFFSAADTRRVFHGKVVWITGASSGIGEATAIACAAAGAKVILSARSETRLAEVAAACVAASPSKDPGTAKVLVLDLAASPATVHAKGAEAEALFGGHGVDVLVNNGGISSRSAALETKLETDSRVLAVNFTAAVALTKAVLPRMVARRSGHIVVMSSVQGKFGLPCRSSYAASKHALQGYFDSLRSEVAADGVGVTVVCPGSVATSLSMNAVKGDGSRHGLMDSTTAKGMDPRTLAAAILTAVARGDHELMICGVTVSSRLPGVFAPCLTVVPVSHTPVPALVLDSQSTNNLVAEHWKMNWIACWVYCH